MKSKTAVASCIQTLEDFLRTDICHGARIHCTFPMKALVLDSWLIQRRMKELNITQISFTDGRKLTLN